MVIKKIDRVLKPGGRLFGFIKDQVIDVSPFHFLLTAFQSQR